MLNARTAKTAIKAMPTASRVAAASTAKRLNCRSRSSLLLSFKHLSHFWGNLGKLRELGVIAAIGGFNVRKINDDRT